MDVEKLIKLLRYCATTYTMYDCSKCVRDNNGQCDEELMSQAADALEELQAENEKLRAELEQVKQLYESEKENFIDFACSGVPNLSPYCLNRHPDCVDERGWCKTEKCRGFSRERGQKED